MLERLRRVVIEHIVPVRVSAAGANTDRGRMLVYIHLVALLAAVSNTVLELVLKGRLMPYLVGFALLVVLLLYIFRRFGNIVLSGNLLAATMAVVLLEGSARAADCIQTISCGCCWCR